MSAACIQHAKRYLCVKKLTVHDGFTSKAVKLPRAEARFFIGELRNRQSIPLVLLDEGGSCWDLFCTCTGGQYALSRIGAFCEAHGAQPGSYFIFYADHEHVVRLAVRRQLPEDVQAAVAAARAAFAVRNSTQRSPPRVQPPAAAATLQDEAPSEATGPPPAPSPPPLPQPVCDDHAPLDEMPPPLPPQCDAVVPPQLRRNAEHPHAPPPRAMPLQDLSNLPQAASPPPSPAAPKPHKPVIPVPVAVLPASPPTGKENKPLPSSGASKESTPTKQHRVRAGPGVSNAPGNFSHPSAPSVQPPPTSARRASSPSGRVPAPPAGLALECSPRRSRSPQSSPPPPPARRGSSSGSGRAPLPPSPPPSSRVRQRFEARLRAQAGRPHPLSVRTDASSPPPLPPGASSPYPGGSGYAGGHGGMSCWPVFKASAPAAAPRPLNGAGSADSRAASAAGAAARTASNHPAPPGAAAVPNHAHEHGPGTRPYWRRSLQCNELLEWEIGRRAALPVPPPLAPPIISRQARSEAGCCQEGHAKSPLAPQQSPAAEAELALAMLPGWVLRREAAPPATAQGARLELLRQMLTQQQGQGRSQTPAAAVAPPVYGTDAGGSGDSPPSAGPGAACSLRKLLNLGLPQRRHPAVAAAASGVPNAHSSASPQLNRDAYGRITSASGAPERSTLPQPQQHRGAGNRRPSWLPWDRHSGQQHSYDLGTGVHMDMDMGVASASGAPAFTADDSAAASPGKAAGTRQGSRRAQGPHEESPSGKRQRAAACSASISAIAAPVLPGCQQDNPASPSPTFDGEAAFSDGNRGGPSQPRQVQVGKGTVPSDATAALEPQAREGLSRRVLMAQDLLTDNVMLEIPAEAASTGDGGAWAKLFVATICRSTAEEEQNNAGGTLAAAANDPMDVDSGFPLHPTATAPVTATDGLPTAAEPTCGRRMESGVEGPAEARQPPINVVMEADGAHYPCQ